MADKLQLILEAERRGILPDDKKAILEEARRRGLVPKADGAVASSAVTPPLYVPDGQGGEIALQNEQRAEYDKGAKEQGKAEKKAKEDWKAKRGYAERAGDTASFVASAIPRMLTRGQYGAGDLVGAVSEPAGESIAKSERDFVQANEATLSGAAEFGEYMAGIPALNTLGAPLRSVGPAVRTMAASPRGTLAGAVRGTGEAVGGRVGRGLQSYADSMQPRQTVKAVRQPSAPQNIQTLPERLRDFGAFRELGMEPFAPALGGSGTARLMRTVEELPVVGGTVKSAKTDVERGAARVQQGIAQQLGSPGSEEATGALAQRALERYRTRGITEIEPSALRGNPVGPQGPVRAPGINAYQPERAAQVMSGPAAERMRDAAPIRAAAGGGTAQTHRGATVAASRPLNQIGLRRTNADDLSDAEVRRLAQAPSRDTSFATRSEALYESAWRKVPPMMRADDTANPNRIGWTNLRTSLAQTQGEIGSQIAGQNTLAGRLADRISNPRSHTSVGELRSIRTEIGRALSNFGQFEIGLDRSQLKRLYAAASRDMEVGLQDLANRTWQRTRLDRSNPDYLSPDVARRADAALYEFRRADRYMRLGMGRMERFMSVLDAKTPNEAARKIIRGLNEKTADPQMLREISRVLRPEELNALRGYIIGNLGRGRAGAQMAETDFNFNHWATDFHKIVDAPGGREFLLQGLPDGVASRLENLARLADRMKYYEATKNFSGSAYSGAGIMALMSPGILASAAGLFGGGAIVGKLMTSKTYTAFLESFMRAQLKAGNTAASNARITAQYIRRLPALAKMQKDPDTQRAIQAIFMAANEQLKGQETEKARALPAPYSSP